MLFYTSDSKLKYLYFQVGVMNLQVVEAGLQYHLDTQSICLLWVEAQ